MRVMVVDDSIDDRFFITRSLKQLGHDVLEFEDGAFALDMLKSDQNFDVIFSNTNMPRMNGFRLLDEVKHFHPHIPVIMMTSAPTPEWIEKCERLKADYCLLLKPQSLEEVIRALSQVEN